MSHGIKLGYRVKHKLHGFTGIVTSVTQYLTGCDHAGVRPEQLDKDGKPVDAQWFDVNILEVISDEAVIQPQTTTEDKPKKVGGPQDKPPTNAI